MKFYRCEHCGNIVIKVKDSGVPTFCCGAKMDAMVANSSDGAFEKHIPVVSTSGHEVTVKVGSVDHPMLDNHYIEWVMIVTESGYQTVNLKPGDAPIAKFVLAEGETVKSCYCYCNLHGLYKAD